MRRLIAVVIAGGAIAAPGQALARDYVGKIKGEPGSSFEFKLSKDGGTKVVRSFEVVGIPMTCETGNAEYGFQGNATGNVHTDRSFKVVQGFGMSGARIRGAFNGTFEKVAGSLRAKTTTAMFGDCRSGRLDWKATQVD